jgi:PBSX family phage terminase large subunit
MDKREVGMVIMDNHTCYSCKVGTMREPVDHHPAYLQCDSCLAIELTYIPQDYQEDMHMVKTGEDDDTDIIAVFGGYGSGKSRSTLQEFLLRALENPRGSGLFAAQTLGQLKKTTLKTFFEEVCPPPLVKHYNKTDGIIVLENGFTIFVVATDDDQKIRSLNIGLAHIEEISGIKKSIYTQVQSRMRDPFTANKAIIVCSNPANTWIVDEFVNNEKRKDPNHPQHADYNPFMRTFVWKTALNKYLPKNYIAMNTAGKPEWYKKKYFEGSFEYNSGMVYPTIAETFIDPYPVTNDTDEHGIPKTWERIVGMDYGLRNPTAVVFGAIDPKNGEVIIYDVYYQREKTLPYHAEQIKAKIKPIPTGAIRYMVADPAIKNRMNDVMSGKNIQMHFMEYGIFWQLGNNNIEYGLTKVGSYIDAKKIKIYKSCLDLIKELLQYVYPEVDIDNADENLDEKPEKKNDHACDALRYMMARLPDDPELLKLSAFEPPKSYSDVHVYDTIEYNDDNKEQYDDYLSYY